MPRSPKTQDPSNEAPVTPEVTEAEVSTEVQVEAPQTEPSHKPRAVSELPHGAKIEDF